MKKTAIILGAVLFLFTASINAQNDTSSKQPASDQSRQPALNQADSKQPLTNTVATTTSNDRWNNWSPDKYKMLPMPEPLTTEKIFPVIGHYSVTAVNKASTTEAMDNSAAASSEVTITLDEANKGVVWVEGLPQGRIKAYLRKSPSTYMIPVQKTADDKDLAEGVLIYDKDANTIDVCIGCKYNNDDPASAFTQPEPVIEEAVVKTKTKSKKGTTKVKVKPVKTWKYSGTKTDVAVSSVPAQQ
ncbi:MAG TPA: hypothetical protein VFI06_16925 [Chitinophagaceae bacterium]|nr:hypothetical protein [Chitinophagaceae bacterium]